MPFPKISIEIRDPIDHGGIGFQSHAQPNAVEEDRSNERPLLRGGGFLFYDGRENHNFVLGKGRVPGECRDPCLPDTIKLLHHDASDLPGREASGQLVGIRVQVAFESVGGNAQFLGEASVSDHPQELGRVDQALRLQPGGDIHGSAAFRESHGPSFDRPSGDRPEDFLGASAGGELVFADVQFLVEPLEPSDRCCRPGASDQPPILEPGGHRRKGRAVFNGEENGLRIGGDRFEK